MVPAGKTSFVCATTVAAAVAAAAVAAGCLRTVVVFSSRRALGVNCKLNNMHIYYTRFWSAPDQPPVCARLFFLVVCIIRPSTDTGTDGCGAVEAPAHNGQMITRQKRVPNGAHTFGMCVLAVLGVVSVGKVLRMTNKRH